MKTEMRKMGKFYRFHSRIEVGFSHKKTGEIAASRNMLILVIKVGKNCRAMSHKKYHKKPLTQEQKEHNRKLASFRMRVENKIREIKIFKIMSNIYRNFQKKYNMRFNIIAGLVNLRHEF